MIIECSPMAYQAALYKKQEREERAREEAKSDLESTLLKHQIETAQLQNELLRAELEKNKK